jgi:hypothetical protein
MDPRKARDPRFGRVDPRLQRVDAETPTQTPPLSGDSDASANPFPLDPSLPAQSNSFPHENQQPQTQPPGQSSSSQSAAYKLRPLFCVVCASNQVKSFIMPYLQPLIPFPESVNGGTSCLVVSLIPSVNLTCWTFILVKQAIKLFPLAPAQRYDCLGHQ